MKKTKFQKWYIKNLHGRMTPYGHRDFQKESWNSSINKIIRLIRYRNREFEGNWQHEDIDYLLEDLKEMIEK